MRTRSSAQGAPAFGGDRVPVASGGATGTDCLLPAVRSWTGAIGDGVARAATPYTGLVDVDAVAGAVADAEGRRLARTAARVLVVELAAARDAGALTGSTSQARFADFVQQAGSPAARADLTGRYPALGGLLDTMTANATAAAAELLDRFAADRADVVAHLLDGTDPGRLVDVEVGAGDRHGGGRAVAVLRFADGRRVVHKPRPVDAMQRFAELVAWLDGHVPGLGLTSARVLARDGHGWVEHVRYAPCTSAGQLDRFHRRLGALAALLYALDATDMHFENLVACADQPVLVDVETLFHPAPPGQLVTGPDPARDAVTSSVLRTALLPMLLVGRHGSLDVSGAGAAGGERHVDDVALWEGAGTDRMRLRRGRGTLPVARNRPVMDGRPVDAVDHRDAVLAGFRAAYDAVLAHRDELLGAGPDHGYAGGLLAVFAPTVTRFLPRDTATYARLLDESTHPDLLRATADARCARRSALHDAVADPGQHAYPGTAALVPHEVEDLVAGDVPLFATTAAGGPVRTADGTPVDATAGTAPRLVAVPGLTAAARKVAALDPLDRADQEWFVRAAFATVARVPVGVPVPAGEPDTGGPVDPQRLLRQACVLGDQLVASAHRRGGRANWPGLQLADGTWSVLPLGADLGDGYPGVALFLAELGRVTGVSRYCELAAAAARPLPDLVAAFAADPRYAAVIGPGPFTGAAGIAAAVARLATLLDDDALRASTEAANETTRAALAAAGTHVPGADLAAGPAATARALALTGQALTGPALTDQAPARTGDLARLAAHLLPDVAPDHLDTSLVSGTSGRVEALTELVAVARRTGHGDLADAAGTARTRALSRLLAVLDRHGPVCATPHAVPTPGLLTGLAGTGHTLLRAASPQVPSALTLGPARSAVHDHEPQPAYPKEVLP